MDHRAVDRPPMCLEPVSEIQLSEDKRLRNKVLTNEDARHSALSSLLVKIILDRRSILALVEPKKPIDKHAFKTDAAKHTYS
jgi:hypothetical protein